MQLHDFYAHTLPPQGHYALFRVATRRHTWATSIEQLVEQTKLLGDKPDIYFATATFNEPGERTQANAAYLKSFRLDLDAGEAKLAKHGEDKIYPTQQAAIADTVRFAKATGLTPSLIVSSGEGLHLYWELDIPLAASEWTPIAKQFQKFGVANGLKIDSSVTADSARILRPVGTLHPNGKRVEVLKATGKVYTAQQFADAVGVVPVAPALVYDTGINDELGNLEIQGPPKAITKVLKNCTAALHAAKNQGTIEEPYWRLMIGLAKHTLEGREAAHALSKGHPLYDPDQTDNYFDRWATGPSTCAKFAEFNPTACAGCKHRGKIKSPIVLGALNTVEVEALPEAQKPLPPPEPAQRGNPWDGHIPKGFDVVTHKGKLTLVNYMETERENENGEMVPMRITVPVTRELFWLGHWADAEHSGDTAQTTLYRLGHGNRISTFVMEQALTASRAEMAKYLAGKGIHTTTDKRALAAMEHYIKDSLEDLKALYRRIKVSDHFGLRILPDGELVSVHGEHVIHPDGSIGTAMLQGGLPSFANNYPLPLPPSLSGEWDKSVWKQHIMPHAMKHVNFLKGYYGVQGMEKYQLAIMLGLASPFMAFANTPFLRGTTLQSNGLSVSLYSRETGRGKTAVMDAALLAYGTPAGLRKDQNNAAATALLRTAKLSLAGTMPSAMDEMGSTDEKAMANLISAIGNGASRERLKQDGSVMVGSPWALICLLATNRSQRDMISAAQEESSAIQYRLLEIDVDDMPQYDADARDAYRRAFEEIHDCAGALGALVQRLICRTGPKDMGALMSDKLREASRHVTLDSQNARFQYRGLAAVLALHHMLELLGIELFPLNGVIDAFRVAHDSARQYVEENVTSVDGAELLSRLLFDVAPHTIITMNETRKGGSSSGYDHAVNRIPDVVKARHVISTEITYVRADALKAWCAEHKVRTAEILGYATKNGIARRVLFSSGGAGELNRKTWSDKFNLLKGMKESTGAFVNCYAFSTSALAKAVGGDHHKDLVALMKQNVVPMQPEDRAVNE